MRGISKKISLTVDVDSVTFQAPHGRAKYIVGKDGMDFIEFMKQYPDHVRATRVNVDGSDGEFYLVFVADCFDPPVAIVRADGPGDAQEWFIEELDWADIDERDYKDYGILPDEPGVEVSEYAQWCSRGKWVDTESIMIHGPLKIVAIEHVPGAE